MVYTPTERQRLSKQLKKQDATLLSTRNHVRYKDTHGLKVDGWRRTYHVNTMKFSHINVRHSRLQERKVIRDKDGHHVMIKGSVVQEDIAIWYITCMPLTTEHQQHVRRKLIKLPRSYR